MGLNAIPGFVVIIISGFLFIVAIMSLFIPIWIWRIKNEIVINSKAGVCPHCGAPVIVGR
jgi:prepilin signal peptidase PulO-like enzyme (type II secretory pathway)